MFPKLTKNNKFLKDYKIFLEEIKKMKNQRLQQKCLHLLEKFKKEAEFIDNGHSSYSGGYINPRNNHDNIINMIDIRKELSQIIKSTKSK